MTNEEINKLVNRINSLKINFLWIGISTPKQEKLAYKLSKILNVDYIVTVGAAFDYHIDKIKPAPKIVQNIGFEWLFRLIMEPKRLWKRYLYIIPNFIIINLSDIFLKYKR